MSVPVWWVDWSDQGVNRGRWDDAMLGDLFDGRLGRVPGMPKFDHTEGPSGAPSNARHAVVVIPARHNADRVEVVNRELAHFDSVLVVLTGDEEHAFPVDQLAHPQRVIWQMTPDPSRRQADRYIGTGYPPQARLLGEMGSSAGDRTHDWFFAGQVTHSRRQEAVRALRGIVNRSGFHGHLVETPSFTAGLDHGDYYRGLVSARVAPAPSGPCSPDSFRLYEALEAGCVPLADGTSPQGGDGFWTLVFGTSPPFPVVTDWSTVPGLVRTVVDDWPRSANRCVAFWQQYKRRVAWNLYDDLVRLGMTERSPSTAMTVLVPVSPIPSHPNTAIVDETVASIRTQLPDVEILLLCDGVRPEQDYRHADWAEAVRRICWKTMHEWSNVTPVVFDRHHHQTGMVRHALDELVWTPLVMFVEQDTPLVDADGETDWDAITLTLAADELDMVRLHHEASILAPHEHLMIDREPVHVGPKDLPVIRTAQFSARPHVARTGWYRWLISSHFRHDARAFIEDHVYGHVLEAWRAEGLRGWDRYRVAIYTPPTPSIRRSWHTNGRDTDPKFEQYLGDPEPE